MEQYIIKGGNPLVGEVVIGGAKNAALPVLAAAVMTDGKCTVIIAAPFAHASTRLLASSVRLLLVERIK